MNRTGILGLLSILTLLSGPALSRTVSVKEVTDAAGATRGICVVLGQPQCELALDLARQTEFLIYTQFPRTQDFESACAKAEKAGYYGSRIFIAKGQPTLHLAGNIADVVVVFDAGDFREGEILRVVRPDGKVFFGDRTITKPVPEGVDDWSHPYHGPDNNPQSDDKVVVAPYLTQFLAEPRYAPLPQVGVASAGRVFKAFGHVAFKAREEPYLNKLVAFNGYNGTILWKRDLAEGVMIHRNTMIATPTTLYVGDDKSCKLIDTVTGALQGEIAPPVDVAGGTFWKWMALENGVLYAMMGEPEQYDSTKRWKFDKHGWPWDPISEGWNQVDNPWGYGRNVLAIDLRTKNVLWSHREQDPIDGRAICMKNGRLYLFAFGKYLACLDAGTGNELWRRTPANAPKLFASLGTYLHRQDWRTNWRTTCYLKCSDKALYFAGPSIGKLLAVSAGDGRILWEHPYDNFQLVLRDEGLYGISGQIDTFPSLKFDPLTGRVLARIDKPRRACTRPTGAADAIFFRAEDGSVRLDTASLRPQWISPMRPVCQEGVTVTNGLLYWWPSVCDCQLTLYGVTCLGAAGDFDFTPEVTLSDRLERTADSTAGLADLPVAAGDWPTFRANNTCSAGSSAMIAEKTRLLWQSDAPSVTVPGLYRVSPPVAAGGLVLVGGTDAIVRAFDSTAGGLRWKARTGGAIRMPPTIWQGRAFVGSGDGWVYSFEAATGRLLWRFRAAPAERMIPVYGAFMSTWPVAAGVLVDNGIAYAAAGIANYDGTYLYALDARTGEVKWHNSTSGHLDAEARTGVSVQGHLLLHDGKLYLAGGSSVSPAVYDAATGRCLNGTRDLVDCFSRSPRGWELSLLADQVVACGKPFYGHPAYDVYDSTVFNRVFVAPKGSEAVVWTTDSSSHRILGFTEFDGQGLARKMANPDNRFVVSWNRIAPPSEPAWSVEFGKVRAMASCANAVLVATDTELVALNSTDGGVRWRQSLPQPPVPWGLAVDDAGRAAVTLVDGKVLCFGQGSGVL
ncbi:MAG: PQQ-binding-like beta-propeller repeat protein [Sedimentisphaerales bacterium]|nr:PQQ-binding-like beta-propeller repeat protein [Sedimentisphaerales bacterium]